jgi:hypothetical protein
MRSETTKVTGNLRNNFILESDRFEMLATKPYQITG